MPWVPVDDPNELAAAAAGFGGSTGGDVKSALTRPEMMTREAAQAKNGELKGFLGMIMEAEGFNRKIPTGRFNARVNAIGQQFPQSWQPNDVSNYQSFMGLRQRMVKPSMGILTGKAPMSGEMNTPAEVQMQMDAVPGPEKEFGANRYLGDTAGKAAQMQMRRNTWQQYWRDNHGSTHATDKAGKTMEQGLQDYMTKGPGAQWANKPMSSYYQDQVNKARPAASGATSQAKRIRFEDLP